MFASGGTELAFGRYWNRRLSHNPAAKQRCWGEPSSAPVLATTPAPKRIRVPARIAEANLVKDVAPKYPPEAGRDRIEGTVVLLAVISKDGTVEDVRVKSGLPVLAQAAIEAVKQWRYRPYLLNGEPVEVDSQITINFTLARG